MLVPVQLDLVRIRNFVGSLKCCPANGMGTVRKIVALKVGPTLGKNVYVAIIHRKILAQALYNERASN